MGLNPMLYDGQVRQHQQELLSQAADARRTSTFRPHPYSRLQRLASRFMWTRTVADMRVPGLRGDPTVLLQAGSAEIAPVIDTSFDARTAPEGATGQPRTAGHAAAHLTRSA